MNDKEIDQLLGRVPKPDPKALANSLTEAIFKALDDSEDLEHILPGDMRVINFIVSETLEKELTGEKT